MRVARGGGNPGQPWFGASARRRRPAAPILAAVLIAILSGPLLASAEPGPSHHVHGRLSKASSALANARAALPESFAEYETARFIVLSDAGTEWSLAQAQRLERTWHQFHRFAHRLDLPLKPLDHKLVCVLFADRGAYQSFARDHDRVADPWIAGYYAPATDRIVFYHGNANPSVVEARSKLNDMEVEIESIARRANAARRDGMFDQARTLHQYEQQYRDHLLDERSRIDRFADQVNVTTTVHEAIHQLLFQTDVQRIGVSYPVWISEGLATSFETDEPGSAFGPDHEYPPRRDAFDRLLEEGGLLPLSRLIPMTSLPPDQTELVHVVYHQSYALITWMSRYRKAALRRYLDLLRDQPGGAISASQQVAIFEEAFGDVQEFEEAWLKHEQDRHARVSSTPIRSDSRE